MNKLATVVITLAALTGAPCADASLRVIGTVEADLRIEGNTDVHVTSDDAAVAAGAVIDLADDACRLFFDNIRPSDVISRYSGSIRVKGEALEPDVNARVTVYRHGTEVLPHDSAFTPLVCYAGAAMSGASEKYMAGPYYSNAPSADVSADNIRPLALDEEIRSFSLARGYMATLAANPDGTGYSRCFIAEDVDLQLESLPEELAGKVSFVRVFPWRQASKKGWVGGNNKTNPPEGYLEAQCDATMSTWVYSWSASADYGRSPEAKGTPWFNQEFVPEKWGHGGDSDWKRIANSTTYTHLLSYNEPDHGEQSNVTVEKAIAEWPRHMQTGLRLGSPATTNFSWLYNFMDEARKRNYRVDYVAIHAYWGGRGSAVQVSSVSEWYAKLKEIHEKTGRPLWITEWNNGANWTHEPWPSDKSEQQEKQRKFMEEVLAMMDTCSFIERYSVYNWVEEKRAMFWGNLNLTPAGKVYRDFNAAAAFDRRKEVIPGWNVNSVPALAIDYAGSRSFDLCWTDEHLEQVEGYAVERSTGADDYERVTTLPFRTSRWSETQPPYGDVSYRVVQLRGEGSEALSNTVGYGCLAKAQPDVLIGRAVIPKGMRHYLLPEGFSANPVVVLGAQTHSMKSPMVTAVSNVDEAVTSFGARSWKYNESDAFVSLDTIAYMAFAAPGRYRIGELPAEAGRIASVGTGRVRVRFPQPFGSVPAVFATVADASGDYPAVARVCSVDAEGFELELRFEQGAGENTRELPVDYVAVATGTTLVDGHDFVAGVARDESVGIYPSRALAIDYGRDIPVAAFFGALQTSGDAAASSLRARNVSGASAAVFKDCEASKGNGAPSTEDVAWCVLSLPAGQNTISITGASEGSLVYREGENVIERTDGADLGTVTLVNAAGQSRVAEASDSLSTAGLAPGLWLAHAGGCAGTLRFIVR